MPFLAIVIALLASVSPFPVQVAQGARSANVEALPTEIPLFPLPEVVLFPGVPRPLLIYEPRYREMVADALKGNKIIGMVLLRPGYEKDYEGRPPIYGIGCAGVIEDYEQLPDGRYGILLRGLTTFRVVSEDQRKSYRLARVEAIPELLKDDERGALSMLRERLAQLLNIVLPLGVEPPDAVMVGDTIEEDVHGALAIGMRELLLDREGRYPDVDGRLDDLRELPAALGLR